MNQTKLRGKWTALSMAVFSMLVVVQLSFAQTSPGGTRRITGKVLTKSKGDPVAGASVTVKGTKNISVTDAAGTFNINAATGETLIVSYVGFGTLERKISSGDNDLNFSLSEDYGTLNNVVVVGYGKMKKTDMTSSQVTVTADEMKRTVNPTFGDGLQGRAANVYVTSSSGQPGAVPSILIRGVNSITGNNQPLYVIDGVQIQTGQPTGGANILAGINPDDIETINVLQGPSATAIYGATGANGVVLISTKKGRAGDTKISFSALTSIQEKPQEVPVMNLPEYATYRNEFAKAGGAAYDPMFSDPSILGQGTNWQDALFRSTLLQKYGLGLSGGSERTTFYIGAEYFDQEGVLAGSDFKRYSVRVNLDNQTRKWLKIGTNLSVNQIQEKVNTTNGFLLETAIKQNPSVPVTNPDGSWGGPSSTQYQYTNPVALAQINNNRNKSMSFIGGIYADITLAKGLVFHNDFNTSYQYSNNYIFNPSYEFNGYKNTTTVSSRTSGSNYWWGFNSRLQYDATFKKHTVSVMGGFEGQEYGWEGLSGQRMNYVTNNIEELPAGDALTATNSSSKGTGARESFISRVNYVYNDRYIFQGTFRADGSSNFGPESRWGYFPALSAAWRISQEDFMKNVTSINDLKLRVEWGITGNSNAYGYYAQLYSVPTAWGTGYLSQNFSNPFMKWEEDHSTNIGFDLSMFRNRLQVIGDFYVKNIQDLLTTNDYPYYSGGDITYSSGYIQFPTTNVGSMQDKGFGITINTVNIEKPFVWRTGLNFSFDKNKVTSLQNNTPINTTYENSSLIGSTNVGQPVGQMTGYIAEGIFENIEQIKNHAVQTATNGTLTVDPNQGTWVGDVMFKDISGPNGKPDGIIDQNDRVVIGNPWPKFTFGFNNAFSYKGFDLNVFIMGVQGNEIYNYTRYENENPQGAGVYSNYFKAVANFARPSSVTPGDETAVLTNPGYEIARISTNNANGNFRATNWYVEDGSYIKIKNITLSYNFPVKWVSKIAMRGLRASAGVQNLATITNYSGLDPEIGMVPYGRTLMVGVDDNRYPSTRMWNFSLVADF